jgi:adenylate cyclase
MADPQSPPPSDDPRQTQTGWRRKWPLVTLFSAIGLALLAAGIAWTYTVHFHKFPPDVADRGALAWPLPDMPSAVVLPIASVSSADRDILVAGRLGDDLRERLARVPGLFVISPETSGRFRGGQFRIKATAEALGVRYLLTGTLSRIDAGKKYRVFLRVIDAFSGDTEWVEDFDLAPERSFELFAKAMPEILDALDVDIDDDEIAAFTALGPRVSAAWIDFAEAVAYRVIEDRQSMADSLAKLKRAHDADPGWSGPAREIAWSYLHLARRGWTDATFPTTDALLREGLRFADALIERDPRDPYGPARKAALSAAAANETEETLALWQEAARLGPNTFSIQWELAQVLIRAERYEEALPVMKRALRVHPRHPVALTQALAELEFAAGNPAVAFTTLDTVILKRPAAEDPRLMRMYLLAKMGREGEAMAEAEAFLALHDGFGFSAWSERQIRRGRPGRAEWRETLLVIGIPD